MKRVAALSSALLLISLAFAAPVLAVAPPGNDTYGGRTVIGALPFSETLDTTKATTDADDDELNAQCGAPATDASVWYELTANAEQTLLVDVSASDYSAGALVAIGSPGNWFVLNCGPGGTVFFTAPGETYTILAFDDQLDGAGNGGTLVISVEPAPPPPEIDITVDPTGTFNSTTGSATITGTVTCSADAEFAFIDVQLTQRVGRFVINGFGFIDVFCDGTTQPWSVEVFGQTGQFKGGQTVTVTFGVACGVFECGFDFEEATVFLRGR